MLQGASHKVVRKSGIGSGNKTPFLVMFPPDHQLSARSIHDSLPQYCSLSLALLKWRWRLLTFFQSLRSSISVSGCLLSCIVSTRIYPIPRELLTLSVRYASSSSVMKSGILLSALQSGDDALVCCRWDILHPEMLKCGKGWLCTGRRIRDYVRWHWHDGVGRSKVVK